MPQNYTSKMTEVRQSSSQQNQSVRWMKTLVGVILAGSLLFILFKELHSLSKGLEESTKSLKELSNRLTKEEKKNEKLRKELRRVKERMDNVLEEFSNMQKVSRDKRAQDAHNGSKKSTRCKRLRHCAEKLVNTDVNCTMVRNCMPSRGKGIRELTQQDGDLIHAYELLSSTLDNAQATPAKQSGIKDDFTAQLSWQRYLSPSDSSIIAVSNAKFNISTGGIYYVYCHLRVGEQVNRIVIRTSSSELFSTLPKFTSNGIGVVRMSRLVKIPSYALLYVEIQFNNSFPENESRNDKMDVLFPYFSNEEQSSNSFGMFLIS